MASATERLYASRRGVRRKQERIDTTAGVLDTVSQILTFAGGQAKKAETAWGEYEAGYKELGGEGFEKPKFGQKGFFKGPKGDVMIDKKMYDRGQIQKAGSFLGSDAAAILNPEQRQQYLGRTAPGRTEATTFTSGIKLGQSGGIDPTMDYTGVDPQKYDALVRSRQGGGVGAKFQKGAEFGKGRVGVRGPDWKFGLNPNLAVAGDTITEADRVKTEKAVQQSALMKWQRDKFVEDQKSYLFNDPAQGSQIAGMAPLTPLTTITDRDIRKPPDLGTQNIEKIDPQEMKTSLFTKLKGYGRDIGHTAKKGVKLINILDEVIPEQPSFAKGGDFITNGPQKIIVGDNPGGRERVTITPLDSEDYKPKGYYGEKRNWLEALYENNRRRKKY